MKLAALGRHDLLTISALDSASVLWLFADSKTMRGCTNSLEVPFPSFSHAVSAKVNLRIEGFTSFSADAWWNVF